MEAKEIRDEGDSEETKNAGGKSQEVCKEIEKLKIFLKI